MAQRDDDFYDDDDFDDVEFSQLERQVCHFCGALHPAGVMLFGPDPNGAPWPACDECCQVAFSNRNAEGNPQFTFRRSMN